jgi:hypothetical protein
MIIIVFFVFFYFIFYNIFNNYLFYKIYNLINYYKINNCISKNNNNLIIISDNFWKDKGYININNLVDIDDERYFLYIYSSIKKDMDLDIIIQSDGGLISSSDAIINILLMYKNKINIYILNSAYSAASMITLVGDNIYMKNYSLLSAVDPQISDENINNGEYIPAKTYINIKKREKKIDNDMMIKYYESELLYNDGIRNLRRMLFGKYKRYQINNIIDEFSSGKYPHFKQFNVNDLKKMGLNINLNIPENIEKIFEIYLKIEDNFRYL